MRLIGDLALVKQEKKSDVGHYTSLNQDTLICCSLISARFSFRGATLFGPTPLALVNWQMIRVSSCCQLLTEQIVT